MVTSSNISPPGTEPITINAYESEKLAEITYLTTSFIGSTVVVNNSIYQKLATGDTTEFEENDQLINLYFDTLRVFLEMDVFSETVNVTNVDGDPNSFIIIFSVDAFEYELHVTFNENDFTGTLIISGVTYEVQGSLEDTNQEFKLQFEAKNGLDFVQVTYKSEEKEDEVESKYQIQQKINNVESSKEVSISNEGNESSVKVSEGANEYQLKKELENGEYKYKLKYEINNIEGEAIITEETDIDGNINYNYQIKEGETEKEVNQNKPDYDYKNEQEEDNKDPDDSSNNPNDNGNQNGNPEKESTYYQKHFQLLST